MKKKFKQKETETNGNKKVWQFLSNNTFKLIIEIPWFWIALLAALVLGKFL
jgi:hypothetical protein